MGHLFSTEDVAEEHQRFLYGAMADSRPVTPKIIRKSARRLFFLGHIDIDQPDRLLFASTARSGDAGDADGDVSARYFNRPFRHGARGI